MRTAADMVTEQVMAISRAPEEMRPWVADMVDGALEDVRDGDPGACRDLDEIIRMACWLTRSAMGLCPFQVDVREART
jgi:hypothetical protein